MNENENIVKQQKAVKLEVSTRPAHSANNPHLLGYARVKIGDLMVIKNIKIVQGPENVFVAPPSVKTKNGEFQSVCFAAKEFRPTFDKAILETFSKTEEAYQKFNGDAGRANFAIKINPYEKDNLKGFAQLSIPNVMYFNNISIRENDAGNLWVSMPGYSYTNEYEEKAYHSFYEPVKTAESLIHGSLVNQYRQATSKLNLSEDKKQQITEPQPVQAEVQHDPLRDLSEDMKQRMAEALKQGKPIDEDILKTLGANYSIFKMETNHGGNNDGIEL